MIRQELAKSKQASRFNLNVNPRVSHTGLDSPPINSSNIKSGLKTTGAVTFAEIKDYKFNVNFTPSLVQFYGIASDIASGYRSLIVGQAALGQNLYFQPTNSSTVTVGGKFEIIQSYAQFLYNNGGAAHATADDQHIIDCTDGSTIFARATVSSYGQNFFVITVDNLAPGWSINGSYFVS